MRSKRSWSTCLLLAAVVGAAAIAHAEVPAGAYVLALESNAALTFPSGETELCEDVDGIFGCITSSAVTDAAGNVSGAGGLELSGEGLEVVLGFEFTGSTGGTIAKPKASLEFELAGVIEEVGSGLEIDVTGTGRMSCKLDRDDPSRLVCKAKTRLCGSALGQSFCDRLTFPVPVAFERVPFLLELDLVTAENGAVTGSAQVEIGGAPSFGYTAKGRHKASSDLLNLKLTGTDPAAKTALALKAGELEAGLGVGGVLKYKLAGQKGVGRVVPPVFVVLPRRLVDPVTICLPRSLEELQSYERDVEPTSSTGAGLVLLNADLAAVYESREELPSEWGGELVRMEPIDRDSLGACPQPR